MARVADLAAIIVISFLLTFVWTTAAFDSWTAVFAVSVAASVMAAVTVVYISRGAKKNCSRDRFELECAMRPPSYLIGLIRAVANAPSTGFGEDHILTPDAVIFAAAKLSPLGMSDLNAFSVKAEKLGRKRAYILAIAVDRRAYRVAAYFGVRVTRVRLRTVYRWLKKHDGLPDLKRIKQKFSFAALFEAVFRRANLKNYLFSGGMLIAVAFLTPLRIYYLVFGSISLIMALLTLTPLGKGPFGEEHVLDTLVVPISEDDASPPPVPPSADGTSSPPEQETNTHSDAPSRE